MTRFCFCIGEDQSIINKMKKDATGAWGSVIKKSIDKFSLFIPEEDFKMSYAETSESIGAVAGYVRYDNFQYPIKRKEDVSFYHNSRFIDALQKKSGWPLGDNVTGSFSAISFSKKEKQLILCNDVIGYIPLYYKENSNGIAGGTSLIVLGKCFSADIDITGVLQRVTKYYYNYGKRTLLKDVKRLLPGEKAEYSGKNNSIRSSFDSSLYTGTVDDRLSEVSENIWDYLKREINLVIESRNRINLTLSGGWDSRLILGGLLSHYNKITCHTYGNEEFYESKIAKKCADCIDSSILYYDLDNLYFPNKEKFEGLVNKTESASFLQWSNMIWTKSNKSKSIILLGDLSDCLDSRNYLEFHTRNKRKKWFFKRLAGHKEKFIFSNLNNFNKWKVSKKNEILDNVISNIPILSRSLINGILKKTIIEETEFDLEQIFKRIEDNLPPYTVQFDEIFRWYHYTRSYQSSQLLQLVPSFYPMSPAMSIRMIRYSTKIHPKLKLRRKLLNEISKQKEFNDLRKISTPTIPFVKNTSPIILQELIWSARHYIDYSLIKRMLKNKKLYKNERLFKSQDYAKEYRRDKTISNISELFSGRWIDPSSFIELAKRRADLSLWPSVNNDIVAPANVSTILDLIYR